MTETLNKTIDQLYHYNMRRRNLSKFIVRFTNSTRGQLRWYTNELKDDITMRKNPQSDALWILIDKYVTEMKKPKNFDEPVTCPPGIKLELWFHIEDRVKSLVQYSRSLISTDKDLIELAKTLPFADWAQSKECSGFSLLSYGKLVGTVRNLANYHSPSALWKMLGLAPITKNGVTKAGSTWMYTGGLTAEDWKQAGYSPTRRSMCYVFGTGLLKAGGGREAPDKWTRYSKIYYDRNEYEKRVHPEMTKMVQHRRAQRVMEKRLVRDIWVKWRNEFRQDAATV